MASRTYKTRGVVLRKTKLGEKDLIVSLLDEDGSLRQAVAKGARKPGGSLAAKMEPYSMLDLMLAEGRNLDVITDARFSKGFPIHLGFEQSLCAAPIAELVGRVAQEELPHAKLFDMTVAAFATLDSSDSEGAVAVAAADLLKTLAVVGFRPSFNICVSCGNSLSAEDLAGQVAFSVLEGGVACSDCRRLSDAVLVDGALLGWANAMMLSPFASIAEMNVSPNVSFSVMSLVQQWCAAHVGKPLKSLEFLFTCGLF